MQKITLTKAEVAEIYALNDKAVAAVVSSAGILQAAAAKGMWFLMHGTSMFINDLYNKLAKASPKDANALRVMYSRAVIDKFGKGGVRRTDTETPTWLKRPTAFIDFSSKEVTDAKGNKVIEGFRLVNVREGTTLTPDQIANVKAARKEIRDGNESALNFPWMTPDAEKRAAEAMDSAKFKQGVQRLLTSAAKSAYANKVSKNTLAEMARVAELSPENIGKVLENFNDEGPNAIKAGAVDDDESGVLIKADDAKNDGLIPVAENKGKIGKIKPEHVN